MTIMTMFLIKGGTAVKELGGKDESLLSGLEATPRAPGGKKLVNKRAVKTMTALDCLTIMLSGHLHNFRPTWPVGLIKQASSSPHFRQCHQ